MAIDQGTGTLSVGQLAARAGVRTDTIRYYERAGLLPEPRRTDGDHRRYGAADLDAASLRAYCQGRIAHHKIPRYVRVSDSFPMTVTGKVRKVEMREISITELGLESAAGIVTA